MLGQRAAVRGLGSGDAFAAGRLGFARFPAGEVGVQVFGPIHGGVFVAYVLVTLVAARVLRWSPVTALLALAASVPPLVTIWFERWATRTGALPSGDAVRTS